MLLGFFILQLLKWVTKSTKEVSGNNLKLQYYFYSAVSGVTNIAKDPKKFLNRSLFKPARASFSRISKR